MTVKEYVSSAPPPTMACCTRRARRTRRIVESVFERLALEEFALRDGRHAVRGERQRHGLRTRPRPVRPW